MYPITVLPITTARWVQFNHNVSSATIFFCLFLFNLSGAFNVLLFLFIRPELLLFKDPEGILKTEVVDQVVDIGTNSSISNDTAKDDHNPQPNGARLVDDGEWVPPLGGDDVVLSHIDSRADV